jgi:hypothetical protein
MDGAVVPRSGLAVSGAARRAALALSILLSAVSSADRAAACAPAPAAGQTVAIASEDAVIVWDGAHQTEHFIRRAAFRTESKDFGFLVPTPTEPKLAEADDAVFDRLSDLVKPEVIVQHRNSYELGSLFLSLRGAKSEAAAAAVPQVTVLQTARVAGLDAVVLEADSASAIGDWLSKHGYAFRPELVSWLEPYVKAKWKISAFKIAKSGDDGSEGVGTKALRMSFSTTKPFYPYREPADQRLAPLSTNPWEKRLLRLFVFSSERVKGDLERPGGWPGEAKFARSLPDVTPLLRGVVPAGDYPKSAWLTAFEDPSDPRPGVADVFFARSEDQSALTPPPIVRVEDRVITIPVELLGLAGACIAGLIAVFVWMKRRAQT